MAMTSMMTVDPEVILTLRPRGGCQLRSPMPIRNMLANSAGGVTAVAPSTHAACHPHL
jgi:hypothetical protein